MKIFIGLVFLLWNFGTFGQVVNIENKRIYSDTTGWNGNVDGSFSVVQNSNLLYTLSTQSKVQYKSKNKKHYYLFVGELRYTRSSKETFANSGLSHLRYAYRIKNSPVKWESYYQIQYNRLLNQRLRTLLGTGLRWKFVDKEKYKAFVGSSVFAEYEEIQPNNQFNRNFRWSNYLSFFIDVNSVVSFTGATYYQPLLSTFKDYRVMGQYSLIVKITKHFRIKTDFTFFTDTRPPAGVRKTIYNSQIGLSFSFD